MKSHFLECHKTSCCTTVFVHSHTQCRQAFPGKAFLKLSCQQCAAILDLPSLASTQLIGRNETVHLAARYSGFTTQTLGRSYWTVLVMSKTFSILAPIQIPHPQASASAEYWFDTRVKWISWVHQCSEETGNKSLCIRQMKCDRQWDKNTLETKTLFRLFLWVVSAQCENAEFMQRGDLMGLRFNFSFKILFRLHCKNLSAGTLMTPPKMEELSETIECGWRKW